MRRNFWLIINFLIIVIFLEFFIWKIYEKDEWKFYQLKWKKEKIQKLEKLINISDNKSEILILKKELNSVKNFKIKKRAIFVKFFNREEYCVSCHIGIKSISKSHPTKIFGCVICHGGDPLNLTVKGAHKSLIGGSNPSDLKYAKISCGKVLSNGIKCHPEIVKRVKTTIMYTMSGVISALFYEWNKTEKFRSEYSIYEVKDDYGKKLKKIPENEFMSDYFRKMCAMCHIGVKNIYSTSNHSSGCSACHVIFENNSHYLGEDPTIDKNKRGLPPYHKITVKIPSSQCLKCHNRSSRYGTSYIGIGENDFYPVPLKNGEFSNNKLLGGRYFFHFQKDIHFEKGMECIDCHTGKEIMGDGKLYDKMTDQIKISCEDCHGFYNKEPKTYKIKYFSDPLLEISNYNLKLGDKIVQTNKGDILWNVKKEKKDFYLYEKITNKKIKIPLIKGDLNHKPNACNRKLECYTCHFSWTVLCFGCHIGYNNKRSQIDFLQGRKTKGRWYEKRGFTRYSELFLIKDKNGKYAPAQFCQSQITIPQLNFFNKVFIHKDNTTSYVITPVQPHTISKGSKRCVDCHNNPLALGIGNENITIYNSKLSGLNIKFSPKEVVSKDGKIQFQSVSDYGIRVLKRNDIKKILDVGKCTFCHHKYSEKLFYYYKKGLPCPRND